jgi:hypothetical protein
MPSSMHALVDTVDLLAQFGKRRRGGRALGHDVKAFKAPLSNGGQVKD